MPSAQQTRRVAASIDRPRPARLPAARPALHLAALQPAQGLGGGWPHGRHTRPAPRSRLARARNRRPIGAGAVLGRQRPPQHRLAALPAPASQAATAPASPAALAPAGRSAGTRWPGRPHCVAGASDRMPAVPPATDVEAAAHAATQSSAAANHSPHSQATSGVLPPPWPAGRCPPRRLRPLLFPPLSLEGRGAWTPPAQPRLRRVRQSAPSSVPQVPRTWATRRTGPGPPGANLGHPRAFTLPGGARPTAGLRNARVTGGGRTSRPVDVSAGRRYVPVL